VSVRQTLRKCLCFFSCKCARKLSLFPLRSNSFPLFLFVSFPPFFSHGAHAPPVTPDLSVIICASFLLPLNGSFRLNPSPVSVLAPCSLWFYFPRPSTLDFPVTNCSLAFLPHCSCFRSSSRDCVWSTTKSSPFALYPFLSS